MRFGMYNIWLNASVSTAPILAIDVPKNDSNPSLSYGYYYHTPVDS